MVFISDNPNPSELAFFGCAFAGTLFFILRVALIALGGFAGDDFGLDDGDVDDAGSEAETEAAFKILSINALSAFIMMFGWGGLTALQDFSLGPVLSFLIALVTGSATGLLTAYIFYLVRKLCSEGEILHLDDLVGKPGSVYERIPSNGVGSVQITHNGMTRELEAKSISSKAIDAFVQVVVKEVSDGVLIVSEA